MALSRDWILEVPGAVGTQLIASGARLGLRSIFYNKFVQYGEREYSPLWSGGLYPAGGRNSGGFKRPRQACPGMRIGSSRNCFASSSAQVSLLSTSWPALRNSK